MCVVLVVSIIIVVRMMFVVFSVCGVIILFVSYVFINRVMGGFIYI